MILYVASYAIGIGNAAWVGVELFSDVNVRSIGAMYAACTNWAGSLVIASTFLTMLENITNWDIFILCWIMFIAFSLFISCYQILLVWNWKKPPISYPTGSM